MIRAWLARRREAAQWRRWRASAAWLRRRYELQRRERRAVFLAWMAQRELPGSPVTPQGGES
jgi:hypothetical protein